jgi:hypothetical protein
MVKPWEQDWSVDDAGVGAGGGSAKPWEQDWSVEGQVRAPEKKRSFADDIAEFGLDFGKRAAGAVVSGVASIPLGIEKGVKSLVRSSVEASGDSMLPAGIYNPGIDTDEAIHGPETARDKDARLLAAERAASAVPNLPGARTLAKAGREGREAIHATTSEATQRAVADSHISGNIFKGEIDFGSDPSVRGYVMQAADVFGSMLPVIAGSLVTRRPGVGGAIGGGMAAGEGAESAAEFIASRTDDQLLEESPFFARLVNGGASFEEARRLTADKASESAALLQGAVASVGDRFTGKLVTGKLDPVLARAAGNSVLGRAAAGGALSAAEEGLQEVGEGAASDIGVASVVPSKEVGEDSAANLVLGALGGGPAGVGRGAYSGVRERISRGRRDVADQTQAGAGGQASETSGGQDAPATGGDAAAAPGLPDTGRATTPVQAPGVVADPTDEAERALRQPANLTALDRANELDAEVARIEQRMAEVTPENGYGPAFDAERADLAQQAEAARAERDAIASTWPAAVRGAPASFSTEAGVKLDGEYALMDADDLVTSHDENLRQNPVFPAELQPRDRTRSASELQVSGIVQRLDPARLGMSADATTGAPIIGADGLVESGNARTIALKRVYQANGQKAADYRAWLRESAQQFGIAPEAVDGMRKPVLVRVRSTPVNRAEFARQANQSTIQRMSPSEQASADAKRLTNLDGLEPDEVGDFSASRDFIRQFMATLPITEQADMIESDGRLSTAGYRRIQNAILARAYGESPTLRRMTESLDNNLANISKALTRAAPAIAAARERIQAGALHDADIAPDLVQAVEGLSAIKDKGWTLAQELGQTDLTGPKYSPEAAELLQFLADNIRSPRRIAEFLQRYHQALEAAGDPNQGSLLGDAQAPTRGELIQQARGTTDGNTAIAEPADQDRGQPDGARSRGEGAGRDEAGADVAASGRQGRAGGQAEWVMFSADSGTLGIPRAEMPQIKAEHRGALTQYLRGRGIEHGAEEDVDPASLKPTQAEFSPAKVEKAKGADGGRSILVSDDGHVLDGHHQWRAALEKGEPIKVIRFAAPMVELLPAARDFPSAEQAEGAEGAAEARLSRKDQTETPAFRRWFGASKVVDEDGKPLVVYHGSTENISEFDTRGDGDEVGSFFTTNPGSLDDYTDGDGGNIALVYLKIENPYEVSVEQWNDGVGLSPREAKRAGHDGFVIRGQDGGDTYIAFRPEQIKSAIGNNGQFDPRSPDIRLSRADDGAAAASNVLQELAATAGQEDGGRISYDELKALADRLKAGMPNMPRVHVLADPSQAPKPLRAYIIRQDAWYDVEGAMHDGELYLFASGLADAERAEHVLIEHEAAHYGLRAVLGPSLKTAMRLIYMQNGKVRKAVTEMQKRGRLSDVVATEEVIVDIPTAELAKLRGWRRVVAMARDWLAERGYQTLAQKLADWIDGGLTEQERADLFVAELVGAARDYVAGKRPGRAGVARGTRLSGSIAEVIERQERWLEREAQARGYRDVEDLATRNYATFEKLAKLWQEKNPEDARLSRSPTKKAASTEAKPGPVERANKLMSAGAQARLGPAVAAVQAARQVTSDPDSRTEILHDVVYRMQDRLIDLKWLQGKIKESGGQISEMNDAYLGEELYHRRAASLQDEFLADELRPLVARMQRAGIRLEQLEAYLHARHAPEANRELARRNLLLAELEQRRAEASAKVDELKRALQHAKANGQYVRGIEEALQEAQAEHGEWQRSQAFTGTAAERAMLSGMSDEEAAAIMAAVPEAKRAAYEGLAAMADEIIKKTREMNVGYGLVSRAEADGWASAYQHYVPLHRDEAHPGGRQSAGQGFSIKGREAKARTGSTARVTNILAHIAAQRETAITRGEKNFVAKKLWLLAAQNPMPDFWSLEVPKATHIDNETGLVTRGPDPNYLNRPNVLAVKTGGKTHAVVFNENNERAMRLVTELKNLDAQDLGWLTQQAAKVTRWISAVNTQYNPVFGVINLARDVQAAALQLSTTELKGQEARVMRGAAAALRAVWRAEREVTAAKREGRPQKAPTDDLGKLWKEMNAAGGMTGYRDVFATIEERAKALDKAIAQVDGGGAKRGLNAMLDMLVDYNTAMEGAVRLSAYQVAVSKGMSRNKAASIAKNLTVNFNRKGSWAKHAGPWFAFFNAAVQGSARMVETLSGPNGRRIIFGGVGLGFVTTMVASALMGGDGDDEDAQTPYQKIPDFVKERALIVPLSGEDYVAIPMPLGYNMLTNAGRVLAEQIMGSGKPGRGAGKAAVEGLSMVLSSFNPLGGSDIVQTVTPTPVDWAVDLLRNKDWTGRAIAMTDRSDLDPTPGHTRAKESATPWAKALSRGLNWVTGGTEFRPGAFSPTPDQIDFVIGTITGGVGREAGKLASTISAPFTGEELPANKIPLVSRVYGNTRSPSAGSQLFYENVREASMIENEVRGRIEADLPIDDLDNAALEIMMEGKEAEAHVRALRRERRHVMEEAAPGYKDEVERLNQEIGLVMDDFNRAVNRARREKKAS